MRVLWITTRTGFVINIKISVTPGPGRVLWAEHLAITNAAGARLAREWGGGATACGGSRGKGAWERATSSHVPPVWRELMLAAAALLARFVYRRVPTAQRNASWPETSATALRMFADTHLTSGTRPGWEQKLVPVAHAPARIPTHVQR